MGRDIGAQRLALVVATVACLAAPGRARAQDGDGDWLRPATAVSILATSLYGAALGVSVATRYAISVAAPLVWQEALGTFVVPGVMVLVMSQLIPAAWQSVPAAV